MVKIVHFDMPSGPVTEGVFSKIGKEIESTVSRGAMESAPHEEIVKESLRSIAEHVPELHEMPHKEPVSPSEVAQPQQTTSPSDDAGVLPAYLSDANNPSVEEVKHTVETLVHMVFEKGLDEAIRASKKYPPFLEDAFHDALIDHLIPELKKRGMLTK